MIARWERAGLPGSLCAGILLLPVIPRSRDAYAAAHAAFEAALARIAHAPPVVDNPLAETPASRFFLAYHGSGDQELQERLAALYLTSCPSLVWTSPHCEEDVRSRRLSTDHCL